MLSSPSIRNLEALRALGLNPDWISVRGWLQENIARLQDNVTLERDVVSMRHLQGALQILGDLIRKQDEARTVFQKINEHRGASGSKKSNT